MTDLKRTVELADFAQQVEAYVGYVAETGAAVVIEVAGHPRCVLSALPTGDPLYEYPEDMTTSASDVGFTRYADD